MRKNRNGRFIQNHAIRVMLAGIFFVVFLVCLVIIILVGHAAEQLGISAEQVRNPWMVMRILFVICMVLSCIVSYLLLSQIFAPMERLSDASIKVAEGDFSIQVTYEGKLKELKNTIENFNCMVKELNSVEVMRNDFVATVSHEFKTPLAAITGYATFLQDPDLTEKEKEELIQKIHFNVDKLNELTENILRLSKLEHQQFLDEPKNFRLDEQLREAIVFLEPKWSKKNIAFDIQLPEIFCKAQKGLLFQVWTNIIGNAIKYTDENGEIKVFLKEKPQHYEVVISDNGIGMSEETMTHMFDKFYQGDTSRKSQGNGLGLALCKEIISKCNGKIVVESTPDVGSVFIIQLPKDKALNTSASSSSVMERK